MNTFTVTTWNLENLFRNGHEFGPPGAEEYAAKLDSLAKTILSLDPDVLAVQEVGGPEPLADLLALLEDRYPHSLLSAAYGLVLCPNWPSRAAKKSRLSRKMVC